MNCPARCDNPWQLLAQRTSTVLQDLTIPDNYWLKEQVLACKIWQSPAITGSKNKYCPARSDNLQQLLAHTVEQVQYCPVRSDNPRQLLAQWTSTFLQDLTIPSNYWLEEQVLSCKIWQSPAITGSNNKYCPARSDKPQQLLARRTSTILQDLTIPGNYWLKEQVLSCKIWQSPAITGSKNKYCPARSDNPRQLLAQRTSTFLKDLTITSKYWLKEQVLSCKMWQSPAITVPTDLLICTDHLTSYICGNETLRWPF